MRFCVLDLGTTFSDYKNEKSKRSEFFDRIRQKEWGTTYLAPVNRLDRGEAPQSLCGPYFIYLVPVQLQRLNLNQAEMVSETPVYCKETPVESRVVPTSTPLARTDQRRTVAKGFSDGGCNGVCPMTRSSVL